MISGDAIRLALMTLKPLTLLEYCPGVGGAPEFEEPKSLEQFFSLAEKIAGLFMSDGGWNRASKHGENYAICLVEKERFEDAYELFSAITDHKQEVLAKPAKGVSFQEIICKPGKLGYEGAYQYACACMKIGQLHQGLGILLEIVTKVPTKCSPIRLQDVRVEALEWLIKYHVSEYKGKELDLHKELEAAKEHQY